MLRSPCEYYQHPSSISSSLDLGNSCVGGVDGSLVSFTSHSAGAFWTSRSGSSNNVNPPTYPDFLSSVENKSYRMEG